MLRDRQQKSLAIAVEIVRAKIMAQARAASIAIGCGAHSDVVRWADGLKAVRSPNYVLLIEGHAAADYWRVFRDVGLRERKGGNLPRTWMRFPPRSAGRPAFHEGVGEAPSKSSPQHASHPINAMLNYAYVVEAGRLARALTARGLILPLGFLHKPKRGRNSLVWDAIEPIWPAIDARVFAFAREREFGRSDFPQAALNVFRLSRELTQLMLHCVMLPRGDVDEAADWMARLIARIGGRSG